MASWTSPRASFKTLPISRVMIWAKSSFWRLRALADLKEQLSALGGGNFTPLAKCPIGSLHGALDILGIRRREFPKLVAGVRRVERLERLAVAESTHWPPMKFLYSILSASFSLASETLYRTLMVTAAATFRGDTVLWKTCG
jgi:hypothetical protein